ncbi:hypothetical protein ACEWY4_004049 [Coilia grayii]|uniref:ribonuclease H n=1 Tax=Coilia grayii TaxID=363190 RepID=A0ABD1KKF4_9TELE
MSQGSQQPGNVVPVDEMQQLHDQLAQLQAEKNRWLQQQPGGSGAASASQPTSAEKFVFIPHDKKCPTFSGKGEYVLDGVLRRDLKQFVRNTPHALLLNVRGEAIRWEREGMPVAMWARSQSVPSAYGLVYGVQGDSRPVANRPAPNPDWVEVKEILKPQQEQLDLLARSVSLLQEAKAPARPPFTGSGKLTPTDLLSRSSDGVSKGSEKVKGKVGVLPHLSCPNIQLLEADIIRESCSPYASPIVLVRKKDGSPRLCVDYRQLNSRTRKDAFPLPRIEETLDALSGACWFSTLDLASGYNQVPVAETDEAKTAFCTPFGLFEWNRMPFGLCNAPSTFQRLMQRLFGDQQCQSLLLYSDDVVVFSSSVDQHLQQLAVVLERLQ